MSDIKTLVMILLAILASPFYKVFGTPIDSKLAPRLPYPVDITQYTVTINGREHQLNGTIQAVRSQLATLYPDLELNSTSTTRDITRSIVKPRSKSSLQCLPIANFGWQRCQSWGIQQGIAFLCDFPESMQQTACYINAGPGTCRLISCVSDSGIWLCNDNDYPIHPSCNYLGSYAQDIYDKCVWDDDYSGFDVLYTGGQEFDTDNYNIIVHSTSCVLG